MFYRVKSHIAKGADHTTTKRTLRKALIAYLVLLLTLTNSLVAFGISLEPRCDLQRDITDTILESGLVLDTFELSATSDGFGNIVLSWDALPDATGYVVYRYSEELATYELIATLTDENSTSWTDETTSVGEIYTYQVTPLLARLSNENSQIVSVESGSDCPVVSISMNDKTATLSWTSIKGAQTYQVYRATSSDGSYSLVTTTKKTRYTDNSLSYGKTYYYKVRGVREDSTTAWSNKATTGLLEKPVTTTDANGNTYVVTGSTTYTGGTMTWPLPANHSICSYFGYRVSPTYGASSNHQGIDISCSYGSKVVAAAGGTVSELSYSSARGYYVVIDHGNGISTLYQHLSSYNSLVVGQLVVAGQTIAYAGNTGVSVSCHLHFEVHVNGTAVNPVSYLY